MNLSKRDIEQRKIAIEEFTDFACDRLRDYMEDELRRNLSENRVSEAISAAVGSVGVSEFLFLEKLESLPPTL
jgi:hypothetical protein